MVQQSAFYDRWITIYDMIMTGVSRYLGMTTSESVFFIIMAKTFMQVLKIFCEFFARISENVFPGNFTSNSHLHPMDNTIYNFG